MSLHATEGHANHGAHIPRYAGTAEREIVTWWPVTHRVDRARTLRWTCECKLTVYYLMAGGGRAWIRRKKRQHVLAPVAVTETDHHRYPEVERLWNLILLGRTR